MLLSIPFTLIPLLAYNFIAFSSTEPAPWLEQVLRVVLPSGAAWVMTVGDLVLIVAMFCLFLEVLKATRTAVGSILDHTLSTFVFITFLLEFLLVERAGTSLFLMLTLIALVDLLAGFSVTIRAARRDIDVG